MNWLDVAGWVGSALLVWSLLQARVLRLRAINLVGCLVLIGYNGALRVWPMVGLNVVLALINMYYLRKLLATRHDEAVYEVVEVGTGDEFLAHVLNVHGADIARFNPNFRFPAGPPADRDAGAAPGSPADRGLGADRVATAGGDLPPAGGGPGRSAFLVLRADEIVGVVLIRDAGDGVAQVELDYVTQRFRDFTPGEFVYRRSRLFTERGYRRVVSPPGMVAPYYDRVGFRRTGDSYTLDLSGTPA